MPTENPTVLVIEQYFEKDSFSQFTIRTSVLGRIFVELLNRHPDGSYDITHKSLQEAPFPRTQTKGSQISVGQVQEDIVIAGLEKTKVI